MNTRTTYILQLPNDTYLASFAQQGWTCQITDRQDKAIQFTSMTLALCVGFCLGFNAGMQAIPYAGQRMFNFHLTDSL